MEDEKIAGVIARQRESFAQLAETQATVAIGEAALVLLARGESLTLESLLAELGQPVRSPLLQHRNTTACKALLAACPRPSSPAPG
jgi:hypothetical protein